MPRARSYRIYTIRHTGATEDQREETYPAASKIAREALKTAVEARKAAAKGGEGLPGEAPAPFHVEIVEQELNIKTLTALNEVVVYSADIDAEGSLISKTAPAYVGR